MRWLLCACTQPVDDPNQDTHDEAAALERLTIMQCEHAPRLIDFVISTLQPGIHYQEVPGGFVVYTFMTKLPGTRMKYHDFWNRTLEERNKIRGAFKVAIM